MDKTIASAFVGQTMGTKIPLAASLADRKAAREILYAYITECASNENGPLVNLPADPWVRQYHLNTLHSLILNCVEKHSDFAMKLLMQVGLSVASTTIFCVGLCHHPIQSLHGYNTKRPGNGFGRQAC